VVIVAATVIGRRRARRPLPGDPPVRPADPAPDPAAGAVRRPAPRRPPRP
jgi:hypothetical protein